MDVLNTGRLDDGILTFSRDGVLLCTYALYIILNFLNARGKGGKGGNPISTGEGEIYPQDLISSIAQHFML